MQQVQGTRTGSQRRDLQSVAGGLGLRFQCYYCRCYFFYLEELGEPERAYSRLKHSHIHIYTHAHSHTRDNTHTHTTPCCYNLFSFLTCFL